MKRVERGYSRVGGRVERVRECAGGFVGVPQLFADLAWFHDKHRSSKRFNNVILFIDIVSPSFRPSP